jgi:phospholipid-binding lipoprotein MlaA
VVLPFFGPSTVRDAIGLVGDSKASLLNRVSDIPERNALYATRVVDVRVKLLPITDQVDRVALDKYTFTRDAYLQKRLNDVYDGDPPEAKDVSDGGDAQPPKP